MKTGTPNFFPTHNGTQQLGLYRQLLAMGMHVSDNVHAFSVSAEGHAGTWRLEAGRVMNRDGFYVFLDGAPVLNDLGRTRSGDHAEDLMAKLIGMKNLNRDLKEWEQVSHLAAVVDDGVGQARLYNSGVIVVVSEAGAHMAGDLAAGGDVSPVSDTLITMLGVISPRKL